MADIHFVRVTIQPSGCELDLAAHDLPAARLISEYLQIKGVECRMQTRFFHDGEKCPTCGREIAEGVNA